MRRREEVSQSTITSIAAGKGLRGRPKPQHISGRRQTEKRHHAAALESSVDDDEREGSRQEGKKSGGELWIYTQIWQIRGEVFLKPEELTKKSLPSKEGRGKEKTKSPVRSRFPPAGSSGVYVGGGG